MQNRETGVSELTHFLVGKFSDGCGVVDDAWVGRKDAVDVCAVFVKLSVDAGCDDRACAVGSTSREGTNITFFGDAEEARNNESFLKFVEVVDFLVTRWEEACVSRFWR